MTESIESRNRLFIELALRSELVSGESVRQIHEEELAATAVGELLQNKALIGSQEREALEALTEIHVRREADTGQASISPNSLEAVTLDRAGDESKNRASDKTDGGASPRSAVPVSRPSDSARYRVTSEHARGGLGVVSLAVDDELNREVVLKHIRHELSDIPDNQSRFLAEAKITGGLEHPGVVPVYSLGNDTEGKPFYAMRYIRGETMASVVDDFHGQGNSVSSKRLENGNHVSQASPGESSSETSVRNVEFRGLCQRLVDVCNVVEYAHSRGVVHRDIKPDNIMLGDYGETIVVDWGLGKLSSDVNPKEADAGASEVDASPLRLDFDRPQTLMGQIAGTPSYMSPEQALGWVDKIGPASDIYSLGATMYYLLTGVAPFPPKGDVTELVSRVIGGEFEAPSEHNSQIPKAVEAICLKAMANKPADRYGSARAMADDIERWLADEPVSAYREPMTVRVGRWMRRHRTFATSLAVLLFTSVIGLAIGLAAVKKEQGRTETRRKEAVKAQREADRQAGIASENAEHAMAQNKLALVTLDSVIFDMQRKLENVPGAQSVRRSILRNVVAGLNQVAKGLDEAPQANTDLAVAYMDLGDVFLRAGKPEDGLSATDEARKLYEKADKLFAQLANDGAEDDRISFGRSSVAQDLGKVAMLQGDSKKARGYYEAALKLMQQFEPPEDQEVERQNHFSVLHEQLGLVAYETGRLDIAADHFRKKLAIDVKFAAGATNSREWQRNLSIAYDRLALLQRKQGQLPEASASYELALQTRQAILDKAPDDAEAQRDVSVSLLNLADLADERGELEDALQRYEKSLAMARTLRKLSPDDREVQRDISILCERLGDLHDKRGETKLAKKYHLEKFEINKSLAGFDPNDARARRDLSLAQERLGDAARVAGDLQAAADFFKQKIRIDSALVKADPDNLDDQRNHGIGHSKLGEVAQQRGDTKLGAESVKRAYDIGSQLVERSPTNVQFQQDLSHYLRQMAEVQMVAGSHAEAGSLFQRKREIDEKLVKQDAANVEAKRQLAIALDGLGKLRRMAQDFATAKQLYNDALDIRLKIYQAEPHARAERGVMVSHTNVGTIAHLTGDSDTALQQWTQAYDIARKRFDQQPDQVAHQRDLSQAYERMADVNAQMLKVTVAQDFLTKKIELDKKLIAAYPDNLADQRNLSIAYERLGDLLSKNGDRQLGEKNFKLSMAIRDELSKKVPGNAQLKSDLMISYAMLGLHENRHYRYAESAAWWTKGIEMISSLSAEAQRQRLFQARLRMFQQRKLTNELAARAVTDLEFVLKQSPNNVPALLGARGVALAVSGKAKEAVETAALLAERQPVTGKNLFESARIYGQATLAVQRDPKLKHDAKLKELATGYADLALKQLQQAEKLRYFATPLAVETLRKSRDFAALKDQPDYKSLRTRILSGKQN